VGNTRAEATTCARSSPGVPLTSRPTFAAPGAAPTSGTPLSAPRRGRVSGMPRHSTAIPRAQRCRATNTTSRSSVPLPGVSSTPLPFTASRLARPHLASGSTRRQTVQRPLATTSKATLALALAWSRASLGHAPPMPRPNVQRIAVKSANLAAAKANPVVAARRTRQIQGSNASVPMMSIRVDRLCTEIVLSIARFSWGIA